MKIQIQRLLLAAWLLMVFSLRAQVVNDGATNTLSNLTNSYTGDVTVGTNGSFTLLILSDNALLTNSANGFIGRNATARSNEVQLLSPSARWLLGNHLFVGNDGSFNRLVVSNGATVRGINGYLGPNAPSSNNLAIVTGPGSVWSNANLFYLGFNGAGNQLVVSDGGVLRNNAASLAVNFTSSNNLAVVTGSGSLWSNASSLQFGGGGRNQLVISNGGFVRSALGAMGLSPSSSNNLAVVTGSGSTWSNAAELYVGNSAAGNQLIVSAGGTAQNGHGYVGANATASNNLALITGAGSVWSNALDLNIGAFSSNNRMIVSNGATVFAANNSFIGPTANGNANSVTVTDPGTRWQANSLLVGDNGALNSLVVSNGGLVESSFAEIGRNAPGDDNEALVTGAGSLWTTPGLLIGDAGSGNRLVISNGAAVRSDTSFIGFFSANNSALVTGSGSVWTNASVLVGRSGSGNRLIANNGGTVFTTAHGFIGFNTNANGNAARVTDPGTRWLMSSNLYVGNTGALSQLIVSDGALVANLQGFLGFSISSTGNTALVSGAGTVWSNLGSIHLGESGWGNRLVVSNGAVVRSASCDFGEFTSGSNNEAMVTGPGSIWTMPAGLDVGLSSSGNRLLIANGGSVSSVGGLFGAGPQSLNNEALVTGAGSSWSNQATLLVGSAGSRNQLVITNSGVVASRDLIVGGLASSTNNHVVVDGGTLRATNATRTGVLDVRRGTNVLNVGLIDVDQLILTNTLGRFEFNGGTLTTRGAAISNNALFIVGASGTNPAVWDIRAGSNHVAGEMYVGNNASFNQLLIPDGGRLLNVECFLGFAPASSNNLATVTGSGSLWTNSQDIYVGGRSVGNQLVVSNGATIVCRSGLIGNNASSSNNLALATGMGSFWTNRGELHVGENGSGNQLVVSNGATVVTSAERIIGDSSGANSNLALVTDAGSRWLGGPSLYVGNRGAFNRLMVTNGALVDVGSEALIGANSTSTGNRLVVDGGTLRVTNATATGLLDILRGTNVLNAGLIEVDVLRMTNGALSQFEFNGGALSVRNSTVNNGQLFRVGNGVSPATFGLAGNGTHVFANGLSVSANGALSGNGTISGMVAVLSGGKLGPGTSIGKILLSNSPSLQGTIIMEISKNGAALTNDQLQVNGALTYGGSLVVTNLGPTALAAGDNFKLFSAGAYAGSFAPLSLPALSFGLDWTNKLLLDGSIEVVNVAVPKFTGITRSGTNVILSGSGGTPNAPYSVLTATNVALPSSNWEGIVTNQFDSSGGFSFTNEIAPNEPSRFFRIRTP